MKDKNQKQLAGTEWLGLFVLFLPGAFFAVVVGAAMVRGIPADAAGTSALARHVIDGVGRLPALLLSVGFAGVGVRCFLWSKGEGTLRHLLGLTGVSAGLAVLLGALSPDGGGALGASTGGAISAGMGVFAGFLAGAITLGAPAWFAWLQADERFSPRNWKTPGRPRALTPESQGGVTADEAQALLPTPIPADRAPDGTTTWAKAPPFAYPEDVRLRGQIPAGAAPLASQHHEGHEPPHPREDPSLERWTPQGVEAAGQLVDADLAAGAPRALDDTESERAHRGRRARAGAPGALTDSAEDWAAQEVSLQPVERFPSPPRPSWERESLLDEEGAAELEHVDEVDEDGDLVDAAELDWDEEREEREDAAEVDQAEEADEGEDEGGEEEADGDFGQVQMDLFGLERDAAERSAQPEVEVALPPEPEPAPAPGAKRAGGSERAAAQAPVEPQPAPAPEAKRVGGSVKTGAVAPAESERASAPEAKRAGGGERTGAQAPAEPRPELAPEVMGAGGGEKTGAQAPAEPEPAPAPDAMLAGASEKTAAQPPPEPEPARKAKRARGSRKAAAQPPPEPEPEPAPKARLTGGRGRAAEQPSAEALPEPAPKAKRARGSKKAAAQPPLEPEPEPAPKAKPGGGRRRAAAQPWAEALPEPEPVAELEVEPEVVLKPRPAPARSAPERSGDLVVDAGCLFLERERVAVSMLQKTFGIDFEECCRILDELQERGLIGPYMGGQQRDILMTREEWLEQVGRS